MTTKYTGAMLLSDLTDDLDDLSTLADRLGWFRAKVQAMTAAGITLSTQDEDDPQAVVVGTDDPLIANRFSLEIGDKTTISLFL